MRALRVAFLAVLSLAVMNAQGLAKTYRVGPAEKSTRISSVAPELAPGDVIELTGDIADNAVIVRSGTQNSPIVIRGVVRNEGGRIVRPRIVAAQRGHAVLKCRGDWVRVENIEFDGGTSHSDEEKDLALVHAGNNLTIINCYFHHFNFKAVLSEGDSGSIDIQFCEFDSCGGIPLNGKSVDIWSWKPGAVMRVEHCYFHDALGQCHIKTHCPRNVIRYNWFENSFAESLNITDRIGNYAAVRPEMAYPMHSDIAGNVFIQGSSPGIHYSMLSTGGHGYDEPGPEGDINIAHNLFIMSTYIGIPVFDLVQGNVDHLRMYNNVFLHMGGPECRVYFRDINWDTPETREFVRRRGSPDPVVEGSNNWAFERSTGIPDTFRNTLRGLNPKFVDLLNGDYRPRPDSPLAGAGLWPLPKGQIVDLVPEYEPQRGVPVDLKPKPRRKTTPPSIGPFEVPERPQDEY